MSNRNRTDVHAPKNLVTEDYEYLGSGYYGSGGEPGYSPLTEPMGQELLDEGWHFGENQAAGACYHCGARLKYYAILMHLPTRTFIRVGETCLGNRFERSSADFHRLRKQAQLDRQRHRILHKRAAWFAVDEDRVVAFEWASYMVNEGSYGWERLRRKFVSSVNRDGSASDRMVRFIMRDMARTERFAEERAAADAAEAEASSPVIEGRIEIVGKILSTRYDEDWGKTNMLVRDDRGFKVWGTVPESIWRAAEGPLVSLRIAFTATVTQSNKDETFGFFKRPTKGRLAD